MARKQNTPQRVRKAVILVAGFGTRFLPATKAIPKEMLPVLDKPGLQYTVEEVVAAGITDVIFVTGRTKRAIEDHFDANAELELSLMQAGKNDLLRHVQAATELANFLYVRQTQPRGTADATLRAKPIIGNEPFLLLYPDDFLLGHENNVAAMLKVYDEYQAPVMGIYKVPRRDVVKYGIIRGKHIRGRVHEVFGVVEKPSLREAPSHFASIKGFVFPPTIFPYLEHVKPGKGGELFLPDAVRDYNEEHSVFACELTGDLYDLGSKVGWLKANLALGLTHPEYRNELRKLLRSV